MNIVDLPGALLSMVTDFLPVSSRAMLAVVSTSIDLSVIEQTTSQPTPYMDRQDEITEKMRAILIDWLVTVHRIRATKPESLYLCVQLIDRYCSVADVTKKNLQLVGVTALLVACKYEETCPLEVSDCVKHCDHAYDRQEVLDMEQTILRELNWRISLPTAYPFLVVFLGLTEASNMTRHAASYYMERTLQEHEFLKYRPSLVSAAAVILALNNPDIRIQEGKYHRKLPGLPKILMECTEFDDNELFECMESIARTIRVPDARVRRGGTSGEVKKKYENEKYLSVSSVVDIPSVAYVREGQQAQIVNRMEKLQRETAAKAQQAQIDRLVNRMENRMEMLQGENDELKEQLVKGKHMVGLAFVVLIACALWCMSQSVMK